MSQKRRILFHLSPWLMALTTFLGSVLLVFSQDLTAADRKEKKPTAQWGVVRYPSIVYSKPDFDAPQIARLQGDQKVRISIRRYVHPSGLGSFYKVKLGKKRVGYISDVDIKAQFGPKNKSLVEEINDEEDGKIKKNQPVGQSRFWGLTLGNVNYAEKVSNKTLDSNTTFYGLKITGPEALGVDIPLDLEMLFHFGAPDYYNSFATNASGLVMLGHVSLLMPLIDMDTASVYYGLGLTYTYTSLSVKVKDDNGSQRELDNQELRAGGLGQFGYARRIGETWLWRAEVKYYLEVNQYFGISMALQRQF